MGDGGTTAVGQTSQRSFPDAGTYSVTLTVTDDDGATNTSSQTLTVNANAGIGSVSGTITILGSSAIDADVNDRLTVGFNNNDFGNAQALLSPVTLGGFANLPNTGVSTGKFVY